MTELEALLILNAIEGIGSRRLKALLDYFKDPRKILSAQKKDLRQVEGISDKLANNILDLKNKVDIKEELDLIKKHQVSLLTINDLDYPENLKNIYDPPVILYVKGKLTKQDLLSVAIVGSRRSSFYGLSMAERFARALADFNFTIVSGMARGIDSASHRAALKEKGRTIAVLGSGLANIYPPENKDLFRQISEFGAVISEFPMRAKPLAANFPRRNRIISGLSLAVIVVEAASKSGALITADCALEQGREVFAVPGAADSANSYGTNRLIKQGAKLIDSVQDLIEELQPKIKYIIKDFKDRNDDSLNNALGPVLTEEENKIYGELSLKPLHIEEINYKLNMPAQKVMALLSRLEIRHIVKQLPGKLFVRAEVNV